MAIVSDLRTTNVDHTSSDHRDMTRRVHHMLNGCVWSSDYSNLHDAAADAAEKGRTLVIAGAHTLDSLLTLKCSVQALSGAKITSSADPAVAIGALEDTTLRYLDIHLPHIDGGGVRVYGLRDCRIHMGHVHNAAVGLDITGSTDMGTQLVSFYLQHFEGCTVALRIQPVAASWCLGNVFYDGHIRLTDEVADGQYAIWVDGTNGLAGRSAWFRPIIENGYAQHIRLDDAQHCAFYECDFHVSNPLVWAGNGTSRCQLVGGANLRAVAIAWDGTGHIPALIGDEWHHIGLTSAHALMALQNRNTDGYATFQIKSREDDLYDNDEWVWQFTAHRMEGRKQGEDYPRMVIRMDSETPGIYAGDGTFYPNTPLVYRNAAGNVQTNDIDFASGRGPVLIDTVTGTRYRLRVTSGALAVDALA